MSDPLTKSPLGWTRAGVDRMVITYEGRPVSVLAGPTASTSLNRLQTAGTGECQQILADLVGRGRKSSRRAVPA